MPVPWLDSQDFIIKLLREIAVHKRRNSSVNIDTGEVLIWFYDKISGQRTELMFEEAIIKTASERRPISDAISSVDKLLDEAISLTKRAGLRNLETSTLNEAYKNNYCRVWPFCNIGNP